MRLNLTETIHAALLSRRFTEYFEGVSFTFPSGKSVVVRVTSTNTASRQPGYRYLKHSIMVKAESSDGLVSYGYGESDVEFLALQKAISESVERTVFQLINRDERTNSNSNGWAAHVTIENARKAAKAELIERDSALLHWLSETPMTRLSESGLPSALLHWVNKELVLAPRFNKASFFISTLGERPSASAMIHDKDGFGFISHAVSNSLHAALERSLGEATRIADLACQGKMKSSGQLRTPEDHALYYAETESFPNWVFAGAELSFHEVEALWNAVRESSNLVSDFKFSEYRCGLLHVVRCQSQSVQNLFFGQTELAKKSGWLNLDRIKKIAGVDSLSPHPHFVP